MTEQTVTVRQRRWGPRLLLVVGLAVGVLSVPYAWTQVAAGGHLSDEADAPAADVVMVLGAQVAPGGTEPMPVLQGRLDTAAALVHAGRARVILVTGDGSGRSGDETAVMTSYLARAGIDPGRIVADPAGLDTYDSCVRARQVYGVERALVVTQSYHLVRAVALCRHVGIDAEGVAAGCPTCRRITLVRNTLRDFLACTKAAWDAATGREPGVASPQSSAVTDALAAT
jgi:vancomycin permeability regulator SanA